MTDHTLESLLSRSHPIPFSGCWAWHGAVNTHGYAQVRVNGKKKVAHVVSYELKCGPLPAGLQIDHLCRVRCCVNPDHLEAVTPSVNVRRGIAIPLFIERNSRPKSPEQRAKLKAILTARNQSPKMREISSRPKSPEHRAKLAALLTERNQSPEMRAIVKRPRSPKKLSTEEASRR